MSKHTSNSRRYFAPEVIQTSGMDCGPASLKCLLDGFGLKTSYGRLREACLTDVDGTSIDTLEEVVIQLGLKAEQIIIPVDHVPLSRTEALPAIVVTALPNGNTHFVVAWRNHGGRVQVMDPGNGRRWPSWDEFLAEMYEHTMELESSDWRDWAGTDDFIGPLDQRMDAIGINAGTRKELVSRAMKDESWVSIAVLDAAVRFVSSLVNAGGLKAGKQASGTLETYFERTVEPSAQRESLIPPMYWTARASEDTEEDGESSPIIVKGAVLVRVLGRRSAGDETEAESPLSPELAEALEQPPENPWRILFGLLKEDGLLNPVVLLMTLALSGSIVVFEALLLRGILDLGELLKTPEQRLWAMGGLLLLVGGSLILELFTARQELRIGRHVDCRLRMAFLAKLRNLADRYIQSRLTSDTANRAHNIHRLRRLPLFVGFMVRIFFTILFTVVGIAWLDPRLTIYAIIIGVVSVTLPLCALPMLSERDLKVQTFRGALATFYFDSLKGLVALFTHGAGRIIRAEHEEMLYEWANAEKRYLHLGVILAGIINLVGYSLAGLLLYVHMSHSEGTGSVILLVYWALSLPLYGQQFADAIRQYPPERNVTLRAVEPLNAPEVDNMELEASEASEQSMDDEDKKRRGVELVLENVDVRLSGHDILYDINLKIEPGSHVAILGPSGAGKSTLVGLLLGWHNPLGGRVLVDGAPLVGKNLELLREYMAWVDPSVQIWNQSLLKNLRYGASSDSLSSLGDIVEDADLIGLVESLPDGLQTVLGESGGLVSGGEGQRVRLGRGLVRGNARLVILDEPFRGLDRSKRKLLLQRVHEWWPNATLLCITHDVEETMSFDRAVVIEDGRIIESGLPIELASRTDSRYRKMLDVEREVYEQLWSGKDWRRLRIEKRRLEEQDTGETRDG